jgi:hypothetical protein
MDGAAAGHAARMAGEAPSIRAVTQEVRGESDDKKKDDSDDDFSDDDGYCPLVIHHNHTILSYHIRHQSRSIIVLTLMIL